MKRKILIMGVILVMCAFMTACGSNNDDEAKEIDKVVSSLRDGTNETSTNATSKSGKKHNVNIKDFPFNRIADNGDKIDKIIDNYSVIKDEKVSFYESDYQNIKSELNSIISDYISTFNKDGIQISYDLDNQNITLTGKAESIKSYSNNIDEICTIIGFYKAITDNNKWAIIVNVYNSETLDKEGTIGVSSDVKFEYSEQKATSTDAD